MISHSSGIVSVDTISDQRRSPTAIRVARPLIKIVADRKSTKYMVHRNIDTESDDVRLASRIRDSSHENAIR